MTERYHMPFFLTDEERMVMGAINMGCLEEHVMIAQNPGPPETDYNVGDQRVTDAVNRLLMWKLIGYSTDAGLTRRHMVLTPEGVRAL